VQGKNKSDTSNNRAQLEQSQNHSENILIYLESMTSWTYRKQSHWALCTHTLQSTNVKVQNVYHGKLHYTYKKLQPQNSCNTIYPRNMVCFRYVIVIKVINNDGDVSSPDLLN